MMKYWLIILSMIMPVCVVGQEKMSFREADSITYALYERGDWAELSKASSGAIALGFDYYYMRMRAGISFFERRNYSRALTQFYKALNFNEGDKNALTYIFWSNYLSGQTARAGYIAGLFSPTDTENLVEMSEMKLRSLTGGYFTTGSNTASLISDFTNSTPLLPVGSQSVPISTNGLWLNLSNTGRNGISADYGVSFTHRKNWLYYLDTTNEAILPRQNIFQYEGYIALNFYEERHFRFSPVVHFVRTGFDYIFPSSGYGLGGLVVDQVKENRLTAGLTAGSVIGYLEPGAEVYITRGNGIRISQITGSLSIYPLGNRSLYAGVIYSGIFEGLFSINNMEPVKGITAGGIIAGRVWIDANFQTGSIRNWVTEQGKLVFNTGEELSIRSVVTVSVPLGKKGAVIFGSGGYYKGESIYYEEFASGETINKLLFNNFSLSGGIKWNF